MSFAPFFSVCLAFGSVVAIVTLFCVFFADDSGQHSALLRRDKGGFGQGAQAVQLAGRRGAVRPAVGVRVAGGGAATGSRGGRSAPAVFAPG